MALWTFYRLDLSDRWPCLAPFHVEDVEFPYSRCKELKAHAYGMPKDRAIFVAPRPSSHNVPPFRRAANRICKAPVFSVDGCVRAKEDATERRLSRCRRKTDTARTMALVAMRDIASDDTTRLPEEQRMRRGVMPWCGMDMADAGGMTPAERSARLAWWQTLPADKQAALQATALDPSVPYEGPLGSVPNRARPVQPNTPPTPAPRTAPADTPSVPQTEHRAPTPASAPPHHPHAEAEPAFSWPEIEYPSVTMPRAENANQNATSCVLPTPTPAPAGVRGMGGGSHPSLDEILDRLRA